MLYVGTSGTSFPMDDGFYPPELNAPGQKERKLTHYATKFNLVCIKSTFVCPLGREAYQQYLAQTTKHPNFRFIITAPKNMTFSRNKETIQRSWRNFWEGIDGKGGCRVLHTAGKLGCVLLEFPTSLVCSLTSMRRLEHYLKIMPEDIDIGLEFKNITWWTKDALSEMASLIEKYTYNRGLTMIMPCIENRIMNAGWAGAMFSTPFVNGKGFKLRPPGNFTVMKLYGSMGQYAGSYDEGGRMDTLVEFIEDMIDDTHAPKGIFCIFNNNETTMCRPLPPIMFEDSVVWPHLWDLPCYATADLPSCLHDALRLRELWRNRGRRLDDEGFVEVTFRT
jgi:uncharacterized protein YecE (DUF72 family)